MLPGIRQKFAVWFFWLRKLVEMLLGQKMLLPLRTEIDARELLEAVYGELQKHASEKIGFEEDLDILIADDSDDRIRRGWMKYQSGILIEVAGRTWVVALGHAWGDYPAHPYSCDLSAGTLPDGAEDLEKRIKMSIVPKGPFGKSLVYAMSAMRDGQLRFKQTYRNYWGGAKEENPLAKSMSSQIESELKRYSIQQPGKSQRWESDLVPVLAEAIVRTLETASVAAGQKKTA